MIYLIFIFVVYFVLFNYLFYNDFFVVLLYDFYYVLIIYICYCKKYYELILRFINFNNDFSVIKFKNEINNIDKGMILMKDIMIIN